MTTSATKPTSISESWEQCAADLPQDTPKHTLQRAQRAFYAGALAAALLAKEGPEALKRVIGECIDFGRQIGR